MFHSIAKYNVGLWQVLGYYYATAKVSEASSTDACMMQYKKVRYFIIRKGDKFPEKPMLSSHGITCIPKLHKVHKVYKLH